MTTFDERQKGYEAKFARDEELRFKATARRNRMLGQWAAGELGLSGPDAEEYVKAVVRADFASPGDDDVIAKVLGDFKVKGVAASEADIRQRIIEFMEQAIAQIEAGK
jgi:hypothetical protein